MFFDEVVYTPGSVDDEIFLTDFPIEIIENSITSQFNNPFEFHSRDYLQTFISQYEYSINNCNENEAEAIEEYRDQFIDFILNLFQKRLSIGIPNIEDYVDSEVHETIHIIYRFFIQNIKRNFVNYIFNYIYSHKEDLENEFGKDRRKDVTTNSFREEIKDEFDIMVLTNLPKIVNRILNDILPAYDFLIMCSDEKPCLETTFVTDKFERYEITGNFSEMYVEMLGDDDKSELVTSVRSRILKKYPSRFTVVGDNMDVPED